MDACPNGEVGDWRLSDLAFLATFALPQRRPDKLATHNPFAQDARIHFDEPSHTYTFDGQRVGRSVTGLLHQFSSEFDAAAALEAMKRSPEWEIKKATLEEQGLGTSDHDFLERWSLNGRVQRSRGTLHHFHCECMVNGVEVEEPHSPEFQQACAIYAQLLDMGLQPWRSELSMYSIVLQCAGQADLVMLAPDGSLVIVDWKRAKQIVYENRFGCLRYPLSHLPDTNYFLYALQLNVYAFFLESEGPYRVSDLFLAVAHPAIPCGQLVRVPRMRAEVDAVIEYEREHGRAIDP
jgi:hypothetical protein